MYQWSQLHHYSAILYEAIPPRKINNLKEIKNLQIEKFKNSIKNTIIICLAIFDHINQNLKLISSIR